MRFPFPLEKTMKVDKNIKKVFRIQDIGHQATKDSDPWKMRNKIRKFYKCPRFNCFERGSRAQQWGWGTEPGRSPELNMWKWEHEETKAARAHRTDTKEDRGTERAVEIPFWVLNMEVLKKTHIKHCRRKDR